MNCQEIQKNLSSYVDGVLSSEEKKLVEGHLTSCGQCSAALADLRKAKDLLRNLDEVFRIQRLEPDSLHQHGSLR